jgi:acyl-CoA reductase-like NAD-dependent aldehyde dehydrogenase
MHSMLIQLGSLQMATWADKINGETFYNSTAGSFSYTIRQPFGVTAGIIPWNGPGMLFLSKIGSSLAAGNTIVVKTSEKAPLSPLLIAALAPEAGFPPGVINVLNGYGLP